MQLSDVIVYISCVSIVLTEVIRNCYQGAFHRYPVKLEGHSLHTVVINYRVGCNFFAITIYAQW